MTMRWRKHTHTHAAPSANIQQSHNPACAISTVTHSVMRVLACWLQGRVECKECSPGTYAAAEGLTSCLNCNEGYFQELRAQTVCLQCDPGTAQSARGQKQCIACVAGKFSNQSAARKCQDCRAGRFQIDPSQEGCLECELGKAQPSSGQNLCITCGIKLLHRRAARLAFLCFCGRCDCCAPLSEPVLQPSHNNRLPSIFPFLFPPPFFSGRPLRR